jgi:MarR family transcriptional regulator, transcriptional regulator for hemolysin
VSPAWRVLAETATAGMTTDQRATLVDLLDGVRSNLLTVEST